MVFLVELSCRGVERKAEFFKAIFRVGWRDLGGPRVCIVLLILVVNVIRFWGLSISPPGFHFDEAIVSAEAISIAETGRSSSGEWAFFVLAGIRNFQGNFQGVRR